jgi:hypothetical protein
VIPIIINFFLKIVNDTFRIEKDKGQIIHEISDVRAATDEVNRSRVSIWRMRSAYMQTFPHPFSSLVYLLFESKVSQ